MAAVRNAGKRTLWGITIGDIVAAGKGSESEVHGIVALATVFRPLYALQEEGVRSRIGSKRVILLFRESASGKGGNIPVAGRTPVTVLCGPVSGDGTPGRPVWAGRHIKVRHL